MTTEREVGAIRVIVEATRTEADEAVEAIARGLCPDEEHPGYCPVPWTTITCRLEELSRKERRSWQADFDEDRRQAEAAGEAVS